ncbi:MAG: histidine kinase, partial [Chloroflexi bacterium]|nr:histidine kinase [Chloroflexota bacterium]
IMNGIQAAAKIEATDPDLPLIILTVSNLDRDLFAGMRSGAVGFLNKNLTPATLVRTLRDFHHTGSLPMSRIMAGKAMAHFQATQAVTTLTLAGKSSDGRNLSSRELHDGLAQQLAILSLRLGRVAEITTLSDPRTNDLAVAQRVLESASMEARRAIAALRSEHVPWQDFELALIAFSAEFSLTHEIDARVWAEPAELRLDSQLQADVLRILQETFSNAARHGRARRIDAVVSAASKTLRLTIYDDGVGFDPATAHQGVGLRSMAERVARRHGRVVVDAAPGKGARIQAWLPLRAPTPGQA